MKRIYKAGGIVLLLSLTCNSALSQNYRKATAAETMVIQKAVDAVLPVIDGFENKDWQKTAGGADSPEYFSVQKHPEQPLSVAPFFEWHFEVRNGSARYNKTIKPYLDKVTAHPPDANDQKQMEEYVKEGDHVKKLSNIYAEVVVNESYLPVKPAQGQVNDLKIHGAYFTYRQPADKILGTEREGLSSYVLVFGNWGKTKLANGNYQFHFKHAPAAAFIENIVIIITGADDRLEELLHNTDWSKINSGLSL